MRTRPHVHGLVLMLAGAAAPLLTAGPYSAASNDPSNAYDAPVPGFLGPDGVGKARLFIGLDEFDDPIYENPNNHLNPVFFAWAGAVADYQPSEMVAVSFSDPALALGPVTGDNFDVVSLGDLGATAIANGDPPGTITLQTSRPVKNLTGADFVIFENGHIAETNQGGAGIGGIFGELAFVEVSADGEDFVRIPATSLTASSPGPYGSINPTNLHGFAGKHLNAFGNSWGTPFDLTDAGLAEVSFIRLVDVPGDGSVTDRNGSPVYDPWKTVGSGGFDLEAVGVISSAMSYAEWPQLGVLDPADRSSDADPDGDGRCNLLEYAFATLPWQADAHGPEFVVVNGHGEITFIRDERLADLVYEVQVSGSLTAGSWTTIASSSGGAPMQSVSGHVPVIAEVSAASIQSIGVIRKVTVRETEPAAACRFLRVKVTTTSDSIPPP